MQWLRKAVSDTARQWVGLCQEQRMASFSSIKYTQTIATLLASEWCRKRQYFLNVWLEHGGGSHNYTAEEVESYQPSTEWVAFLRDTAQALERANALNGCLDSHKLLLLPALPCEAKRHSVCASSPNPVTSVHLCDTTYMTHPLG